MHKKLAADLISLAHSILQMKNKEDVLILKQKSYEIYEKLAVLAYVEEYINTTPNAEETKESLIDKVEKASEKLQNTLQTPIIVEEETTSQEIEAPVNTLFEQPFDALEEILFEDVADAKEEHVQEKKALSLEEELQDTISIDVAADLFEKVKPKKSLNDQLQTDVSMGLNDRIVFVKNLFDGNQEDFNRVLSQLNSFKTAEETKSFINKMVKPDYNWEGKEELEERFVTIVTLKFGS